jgi:WD40 repeat protein
VFFFWRMMIKSFRGFLSVMTQCYKLFLGLTPRSGVSAEVYEVDGMDQVASHRAAFKYDLFISYRRKDGLPFANWVREKLVTYRLPRAFGDRSKVRLRVYQDTAYERATEDFWKNIVLPALQSSRYLGVVATPGALELRTDGQPNWVEREIAAFTAMSQGANVFVLRGIVSRNEMLPGSLHEKFPHIERVDICDVRPAWKRLRKGGLLRDRLLTLAATLHDVPPEEMPILRQEEERRKRRTAWAVAFVSAILLGIVTVLAVAWLRQRDVARQERDIAVARQLGAEASLVLKDNPGDIELSVLLAVESMNRSPLFENDAAIREGLRLFLKPVASEEIRTFRAVAFGPDSQFAAVTIGDKVVRIVELPGGKQLLRMDHPDSILALALSPDGHYLATVSADTNVRIFDVKTGAVLSQLSGLGRNIAITFSPDGRYLSSGGEDKSVRIFESGGWKQVLQLDYERPVKAVTFTKDGHYLLSRCGQLANTAEVDSWRIFDMVARKNISLLADMFSSSFASLTFGANGRFMIYAVLFDARRGKEREQLSGQFSAAALSPDGNFITACGNLASIDKTCRVYRSTAPFEMLRELPAHRDVVAAIAYSPDSRYVSTTSAGTVRVFAAATGTEVGDIPNQGTGSAVVFSPDSRYLVTGVGSEHLRIYSLGADVILDLANRGRAHPVSFSADGRYVAYAGSVQLFETQNGRELLPKPNLGSADAVALSPDGGYLAITRRGPPLVVNIASGEVVGLGSGGGEVIAFSADGKLLATESSSGVEVIRLSDGTKLFERTDLESLRSLAFSPNARYLAVGGTEGASVFELQSGLKTLQVNHGHYIVHSVAFSPNGRYFASGSLDKIVPIYDMTSHLEAHRVIHQETIFAIAFSPDSRYIATGGADKTARVFELSSEREVARMNLRGAVRALVFSPDMRYLTTATGDGNAVVTNHLLRPKDLIKEACSRLTRNLTREGEWKQYFGEGEPYRKTCPKLP